MKFKAFSFVLVLSLSMGAFAQEKIIMLKDAPNLGGQFEVVPDGSKIFFSANNGKFAVFNAEGKVIDSISVAGGRTRELFPLPDGWFIARSPTRADTLRCIGPTAARPRSSSTRRQSPVAAQRSHRMDDAHRHRGGCRAKKSSRWIRQSHRATSRIRISRASQSSISTGNFFPTSAVTTAASRVKTTRWHVVRRHRNRFEASARLRHRAAYERAARARLYGKEIAHVPGVGGIAVFPDGRIAVGDPDPKSPAIRVYPADFDDELNDSKIIKLPASATFTDLEADASGRLYATGGDASVYFGAGRPI